MAEKNIQNKKDKKQGKSLKEKRALKHAKKAERDNSRRLA
jgi:hypothetical protein